MGLVGVAGPVKLMNLAIPDALVGLAGVLGPVVGLEGMVGLAGVVGIVGEVGLVAVVVAVRSEGLEVLARLAAAVVPANISALSIVPSGVKYMSGLIGTPSFPIASVSLQSELSTVDGWKRTCFFVRCGGSGVVSGVSVSGSHFLRLEGEEEVS